MWMLFMILSHTSKLIIKHNKQIYKIIKYVFHEEITKDPCRVVMLLLLLVSCILLAQEIFIGPSAGCGTGFGAGSISILPKIVWDIEEF